MINENDILLFFQRLEARPSGVHYALQVLPMKIGFAPKEDMWRVYEGWASCFPGRPIKFSGSVEMHTHIREFELPRAASLATVLPIQIHLDMPAAEIDHPVFVSTARGYALHEKPLTVKLDVDFVLALPTAQRQVRIGNAMSRDIPACVRPKSPPGPTLGSKIAAEMAQTRIGVGAYLVVHDAEKKNPGVLWLRRERTTGVFDAVIYTPEKLPEPSPREWHQSLSYDVAKNHYDDEVRVATTLRG